MKKKYIVAFIFFTMAMSFMSYARYVLADDLADCTTYCTNLGKAGSELQTCITDCVNEKSKKSGSSATTTFDNPLKFNSIEEVLTSVMNNLKGIIATIAIIFIILGGALYMLSAGDEKMITRAKACWTAAVIGFAIAIAAPTFLREIKLILGGSDTGEGLRLIDIAKNILNLLLSIIGIIAIISLVVGGGMYLTAYGDEKKLETAKKIVTYAVIGITVALGSLVIVTQVSDVITGK